MNKLKWQPLFSDGDIKDKILNTIQNISSELEMNTETKPGLLLGNAGESIFWAYFARMKLSNIYCDKCIDLISAALNSMEETELELNFSVGISGILWAFNHLIEIDVIDGNITDIISDEILSFLIKFSEAHLKEGRYDYLHEGLGPHLFFLSTVSNKYCRKALEDSLKILEKSSKKFNGGMAWPMKALEMDESNIKEKSYNLGLSHGNPSIAVILARMLQNDINPRETKDLLGKNIQWMLDKKQSITSSSLFPNTYTNNSDFVHSRLAWCYGDLGIAIALYQAGIITENTSWIKNSIEIAIHASKRRDLSEALLRDAPICHGTIGVAHIFNRFFQYTGIEDFKQAAIYWYLQSLNFFELPQGMKIFRPLEEVNKFEYVRGLLEGIAGIGLGLIAAISDIEPKWDRVLLLS